MSSTGRKTLLFIILVSSSLVSMALFLDKSFLNRGISDFVGDKSFEALLQFFLITIIGGSAFAIFELYKDDREKREKNITILQEIDMELNKAFRGMKVSKRKIRSRIERSNGDNKIKEKIFFECMEEFLQAQIAIEEVQDDIQSRKILFSKADFDNIDMSLHYAARYFHDVFEDFEKGRIRKEEDSYFVDPNCRNLCDFIFRSAGPSDLRDQVAGLTARNSTLEDRYAALAKIVHIREKLGTRERHGVVAYAAIRLASDHLQELIDSTHD